MGLDFCVVSSVLLLYHTRIKGSSYSAVQCIPLAGGKQKIARTTILKKNENETTPLCSSQKYSEPFVR